MKTQKLMALALSAALAASMLAACGGKDGTLPLDYETVNRILHDSGHSVTAAPDEALTRAAKETAETLPAYDRAAFDEAFAALLAEEIAVRAGAAAPVWCYLYDDADYPTRPTGTPGRYESVAAMLVSLHGEDSAVTAVRFTARDGRKCLLFAGMAEN